MNHTSTPQTHRTGRRKGVIGVAAGLVAGGTIGLLATVPSITSAASEDGADAVVALQDGTDTADTPGVTDEQPEPGDRLRTVLQPLVDDGTINGAQADAVTDHLVENMPDRPRRGQRGLDGHGRNNAVVADLLGIDRETLRAELEAGNSIADIAEANGIEIQTVIDALVSDAESHVDLAIAHGVSEEEAAERLANVTERINEGVYNTRTTDG